MSCKSNNHSHTVDFTTSESSPIFKIDHNNLPTENYHIPQYYSI